MNIKQITIAGVEDDLVIRRTETGAAVSANGVEFDVDRHDNREERYGIALNAASVVYGASRRRHANATYSMVHDILREIERVAGC